MLRYKNLKVISQRAIFRTIQYDNVSCILGIRIVDNDTMLPLTHTAIFAIVFNVGYTVQEATLRHDSITRCEDHRYLAVFHLIVRYRSVRLPRLALMNTRISYE